MLRWASSRDGDAACCAGFLHHLGGHITWPRYYSHQRQDWKGNELAPYDLHVQRFAVEGCTAALFGCASCRACWWKHTEVDGRSLLREHFGRSQSLQRFHSEARAKPCAMVPVRRSPGLHCHALPGTAYAYVVY